MLRYWKQGWWVLAAGFLALTIVADVEARPFRRRIYRNGGYNSYFTSYRGVYGATGAGVNVTAPCVDVMAGPGGTSVVAPGVGVNVGVNRTPWFCAMSSRHKSSDCRYDSLMPAPLAWLDDALADLDRRDLRRKLAMRRGPQRGDQIKIDGQSLVNFGSNDYLGLAADPQILAAAHAAIDECGWGSGASPLITGRSSLHAELERKLAEFEGTEAALLFPSGYAANVGAITALVGKGGAVFSDELNHASIIDGCRLSGAKIHIYRHCDTQHLRELLASESQQNGAGRRQLIVTDTLFSMHGDFAPLPDLAKLAEEFAAMLMVDEAHATGVFGDNGRGLCEALGVEDAVQIRIGTLSKAFGSSGGFFGGSQPLLDWLANRARPYFFSTAAPAASAAAGLAALKLADSARRQRLSHLVSHLRQSLERCGLIESGSPSQIVPIILGETERALKAAIGLRQRGFFVPAIRPPSVPEVQSLLRISVTYLHTEQQLDDLVAALQEVTR